VLSHSGRNITELMAKSFNIAMELKEFFDLDAIHKEEAASGFYTHDALEVENLLKSEVTNEEEMKYLASFLYNLRWNFFNDEHVDYQSGSAQLLFCSTFWDCDHQEFQKRRITSPRVAAIQPLSQMRTLRYSIDFLSSSFSFL
jgi:hypothetical protein